MWPMDLQGVVSFCLSCGDGVCSLCADGTMQGSAVVSGGSAPEPRVSVSTGL